VARLEEWTQEILVVDIEVNEGQLPCGKRLNRINSHQNFPKGMADVQ
jgi:hypothetical protein